MISGHETLLITLATITLLGGHVEIGGLVKRSTKRTSLEPSTPKVARRQKHWLAKGARPAVPSLDAPLHLLAGTLAVSYGEALTSFTSRRSRRALLEELELLEGVASKRQLDAALKQRMHELDTGRSAVDREIAACMEGAVWSRHASLSIMNLQFLLNNVRSGQQVEVRHVNCAAWQIQHTARLLRFGAALGWLNDAEVNQGLFDLAHHYKRHYSNWSDFSLSFLCVHALVSPIDMHDLGAWPSLAKSHFVFVDQADAAAPGAVA